MTILLLILSVLMSYMMIEVLPPDKVRRVFAEKIEDFLKWIKP